MRTLGLLAIVVAVGLPAGAGVAGAATRFNGPRNGSEAGRAGRRSTERLERTKARLRAAWEQRRASQQGPGDATKDRATDTPKGASTTSGEHTASKTGQADSRETTTKLSFDNHRVRVGLAVAGVLAALVLAPKFTIAVVGAGVLAALGYALVPPLLAAIQHDGKGNRFDVFSEALKAHLTDTAAGLKAHADRFRDVGQGAGKAWHGTLSWLGEALGTLAGNSARTATASN